MSHRRAQTLTPPRSHRPRSCRLTRSPPKRRSPTTVAVLDLLRCLVGVASFEEARRGGCGFRDIEQLARAAGETCVWNTVSCRRVRYLQYPKLGFTTDGLSTYGGERPERFDTRSLKTSARKKTATMYIMYMFNSGLERTKSSMLFSVETPQCIAHTCILSYIIHNHDAELLCTYGAKTYCFLHYIVGTTGDCYNCVSPEMLKCCGIGI